KVQRHVEILRIQQGRGKRLTPCPGTSVRGTAHRNLPFSFSGRDAGGYFGGSLPSTRRLVAGILMLSLDRSGAYGQPGAGQGNGNGKGHNKHDRDDDDDDRGRGYRYNDHDRDEMRGWYRHHHDDDLPPGLAKRDRLPPGLEKQLVVRGTLPPGLRKKVEPCPRELEVMLPPPPPNYVHVVIGGDLVMYNRATLQIGDAFRLDAAF